MDALIGSSIFKGHFTGNAVIVVSSDLEEVLGLAHRVMVLARGRNQGILEAAEATPSKVMQLATL